MKSCIILICVALLLLINCTNSHAGSTQSKKLGVGFTSDDLFGGRFGYLSIRYNVKQIFLEGDFGIAKSEEQIISGYIGKAGYYFNTPDKKISPYLGAGYGVLSVKNRSGFSGRFLMGVSLNLRESLDLIMESGISYEKFDNVSLIKVIGTSQPTISILYYF